MTHVNICDEIVISEKNGFGCICLNRPKALNALSQDMITRYTIALKDWAKRPEIKAVIVEGAGDRAFCAGGDVRALYDAQQSHTGEPPSPIGRKFFEAEYGLNFAIHTFPKPHISLIQGIAMGGGAGISMNGSHRIVDETARFAMPEVKIGFVPDVGSSFFLNRTAGPAVGAWLAVTGELIAAKDMYALGLATHFVSAKHRQGLKAALLEDGGCNLEDIVSEYSAPPEIEDPLPIQAIEAAFSAKTFWQCAATLKDMAIEGPYTDWAGLQLEAISQGSPMSQAIAVALLRRSEGQPLQDCLKYEFRCSQFLLSHKNFYEGVRCALIDKHETPKWSPSLLEDVTESLVIKAFEVAPHGDLSLV